MTESFPLDRSDDRLIKALEALGDNKKAKQVFVALAYLYPECGIYWDNGEESAHIENDDFQIKVLA